MSRAMPMHAGGHAAPAHLITDGASDDAVCPVIDNVDADARVEGVDKGGGHSLGAEEQVGRGWLSPERRHSHLACMGAAEKEKEECEAWHSSLFGFASQVSCPVGKSVSVNTAGPAAKTPFREMKLLAFALLAFIVFTQYCAGAYPLLLLRVQHADNVFVGAIHKEVCFANTPYDGIQPLDPYSFSVCQNDVVGGWIGVAGAPKLWTVRSAIQVAAHISPQPHSVHLLAKVNAFICITKDRLQGEAHVPCHANPSSLSHCAACHACSCLRPRHRLRSHLQSLYPNVPKLRVRQLSGACHHGPLEHHSLLLLSG